MVWSLANAKRRKKLGEDAQKSRSSIMGRRAAIVVVIIYNLVGFADIFSTNYAISSGAGYESNPFIRALMENAGAGWMLAKLFLQGVISFMVLWFPHWIVVSFFAVATAGNALVVYNNFVIAGML